MNLTGRLSKLEESQRRADGGLVERIAFVIERPAEAATLYGAAAVRRVIELVEIARQRRAEHEQS